VMPSGIQPEVFGGEMSDACEFSQPRRGRNEIFGLMMRHWNAIAGTLVSTAKFYVPLLLEDEHGVAHGNDWARGFMRGMHMRHDGWAELVEDEEHGGWLIPMMMLCHEHDADPKMRPQADHPEKREDIIVHMAWAGGGVSVFPGAPKKPTWQYIAPESRRTAPRSERNDPWSVRLSGKKYKKCCGGATVN